MASHSQSSSAGFGGARQRKGSADLPLHQQLPERTLPERTTAPEQAASPLRRPMTPMSPIELGMLTGENWPAHLNYPPYGFCCNGVVFLAEEDFYVGGDALSDAQVRQEFVDFHWNRMIVRQARMRSVPDAGSGGWKNLVTRKEEMDWDYHLRLVDVEEGAAPGSASSSTSSYSPPDLFPEEQNQLSLHPALHKKITTELDHEPFDLSKPLWKAYVVRLKNRKTARGNSSSTSTSSSSPTSVVTSCLLFRFHHAVTDGVNSMKLMDDFVTDLDEPADILGQFALKFNPKTAGNKKDHAGAKRKKSCFCSVYNPFYLLLFYLLYPILIKLPLFVLDVFLSFFAFLYMSVRPLGTYCVFYRQNRETVKNHNGLKRNIESKKLFFPPLPFEVVKALKNKKKVTVNDVVMSAFGAAVGRYCAEVSGDANFAEGKRKRAALRALIPMALPVAGSDPQDGLLNNFTFLSAPLPVHLESARDRLLYTAREMRKFKNSVIGPLALFLVQFTGKILAQSVVSETGCSIFERNCVVFSNVPGYVVPNEKFDRKANAAGAKVFPQLHLENSSLSASGEPAYRSLKFANAKIRGLYFYFDNTIPQVILTSYQDKVFLSLVFNPELIPDEKAFVELYCEELYLLAEECVEDVVGDVDGDVEVLRRFLLEKPIPRRKICQGVNGPRSDSNAAAGLRDWEARDQDKPLLQMAG